MADAAKDADGDRLNIKIVDVHGAATSVLVRSKTPFAKIWKAWRDKHGHSASTGFRFLYLGKRVNAEDSPKMLEMKDGDEVSVTIEQLGGAPQ